MTCAFPRPGTSKRDWLGNTASRVSCTTTTGSAVGGCWEGPSRKCCNPGQPDFPFALCWANESWYRRWQGSTDEMLLEQVFSEEDDVLHIRWLIECVQGSEVHPYRRAPAAHGLSRRPPSGAEAHRGVVAHECEGGGRGATPWLVQFETSDETAWTRIRLGFDASAEFVPHLISSLVETPSQTSSARTESHIMYDYEDVASAYLDRPAVAWQRYPCVATGWDNSRGDRPARR